MKFEFRRWIPKVWPRYHFPELSGEKESPELGIWMHLDWFGFDVAKWRPRSVEALRAHGVSHWLAYPHGMKGIKF